MHKRRREAAELALAEAIRRVAPLWFFTPGWLLVSLQGPKWA